jgi:hypothetical protein
MRCRAHVSRKQEAAGGNGSAEFAADDALEALGTLAFLSAGAAFAAVSLRIASLSKQ